MKIKLLKFFTLLFVSFSYAQTPCTSGFAGVYPCDEIDLMSRLTLTQLGGTASTEGNDCWGWTDPVNGREYAIIGTTTHTAFVDITNPTTPIYLGKINSRNNVSSIWRDIKVYKNYAFIVSEAAGHGIQIFDLTRLRTVTTPVVFTPDALYSGFGNCHNIAINETSGFAYCIGTNTFGGGPRVVNIQNPLNPVFSFGYANAGYSHDAQIVTYNGPDINYTGQEIFFGANENEVVIMNVTNKANPVILSSFTYSNVSYTHQGWLTPDQKYFIVGDEEDEVTFGNNTRSIIVDLTSLDNPALKGQYFGPTAAIDHNGYTKENEFYLANYTAGLRILNTSNINGSGTMNEVGYFDTYPSNNVNQFNGAWSNYPYFPSGNVIISDIERGLFIVRKKPILGTSEFETKEFKIYPNPAKNSFSIQSKIDIEELVIYNSVGQLVKKFAKSKNYDISGLPKGVYFISINNENKEKLIIE
ncbi:choice-of-anchor B family protein [Chryseobacterium sp. MP_3.2]|uniref:choice-of-anchor B family protein n=1 Tax=Chryseobacterium sp. MP_3.2 TaxID=3071712 RepID=UPI002DF8D625|nr:choice-of-anchor B domain-containing protein [Chryseobacterium sp. MP_3.2]